MKRAYICMPMRGRQQNIIEEEIDKALNLMFFCTKKKYVQINYNPDLAKMRPLVALGESIKSMDQADVVLVFDGYDDSSGCIVEIEAAERYKKPIVYVKDLQAALEDTENN